MTSSCSRSRRWKERSFQYVSGLEQLVDQGPIRIYLPTGSERHRAVRMAAAMRFAGHASIVWTDLAGLELLAPGTNKGEAVAWLAASRGIALDEVAAVGDAANDTEMLRVAGRSAAMGSAPGEVQAAADIVVPPAGEAGIIEALRWFFPDLIGPARQPIGRSTARTIHAEALNVLPPSPGRESAVRPR